MSRFVSGFTESNSILNRAPVFTTGGSTTGVISTSATPAGNAVAIKSQADLLGTGAGGSTTNGVNVLSVIGTQVGPTAWYSGGPTARGCTWTVPVGVNRIFAQVWGGGGGGGAPGCRAMSEGGGAGGYTHQTFAVQAGDVLCICAGGGGCRGFCCGRPGGNGTISYVCNSARSIQLRAYPGVGGRCRIENYGKSAGGSGSGAGGGFNLVGQCAASDANCSCHKYCGSGRARAFQMGIGGASFGGFNSTQAGATATLCSGVCGLGNTSPGGGGAGSGMNYPQSTKGGHGGPGLVMIWF